MAGGWLRSGDLGRYDEAIACYQKILALPATGQAKGRIERSQRRTFAAATSRVSTTDR